jgi:DNA-directed RNA polymerase subunit F
MTSNEKAEHISLVEVKQILTKVEKDRKELLYEQRIALEHANKFAKMPLKKINELIKDLEKINRIDTHYAYKIADLLPKTEEDIKTIFAKERITLKENDIKEILKSVNKYYIE